MILNYDSNKGKENGFISGFTSLFFQLKKDIPDVSNEVQKLFDKFDSKKGFNDFLKSFDINKLNDTVFKSWVDGLNETEKASMTAGDALEKYKTHLTEIGSQTTTFTKIGSALRTIGGTLLSTFANMAVMYAASAAIEAIGTAIYNTIHATEIAIEKGEEAKQVIADIGDTYNSKKNTVDTNKDRYIELSVGVNTKTNENLSLTADEYNEFLNITNQLAETFPSLVTGYDAQGNALLSLSGNANDTSASLEKLLEQERQLADFKVSQNLQDAFDGTITQIGVLQDEIDNTMQRISELEDVKEGLDVSNKSNLTDLGFSKTDDGFEYSLDLFSVNGDNESFERFTAQQNAFIQAAKDAGIEETNNMWQDINENAMDNAGQTGMSWTGHIYNITKDQLDTFTSSYKEAIKESGIDVTESLVDAYQIKSADQKEIQANWNSLVPSLITAMSVYDGYDKLGEGVKQAINTGIGGIDPIKEWLGDDGKVHTPDNIRAYLREKFLDPITDVLESDALSANQKSTFQDSINNLFSLDTSNLNVSEYETQFDKYLGQIHDYFNKVYGADGDSKFDDFLITFGFKMVTEDGTLLDTPDALKYDLKERLGQEGADLSNIKLDDLTYEQLVNVHTTVTDLSYGGTVEDAIKEETQKAQNTLDSIEPITFASLFVSDEEGSFNKQVDQFQSNISSIESALEGLKSGSLKNSDITDLMQQFPELIGQSNNLEQALSNLKSQNLSDTIGSILKNVKDNEIQLSEASDFISNLFGSVDLSDVNLGEVKNKIVSQLLPSSTDAVDRQMVTDYINNLFSGIDSQVNSLYAFRTSVEDAIKAQDNLKSAFISSKSATGLTTEEINNVTSAYKDLEGFDAETLFEKTANGVHLNTDAMKLLNEQLEATTKQGYLEQIAEKQKEINDLLSENPQADVSGLEAELSTLQQLSAQYDAATSAYNNFIKAQSGGNERDYYENVAKSYESMKETLEQGWYGDESLNSYLDLMLSVSQRTGDAQADFEKLDKTIEGTSHSLLDYWSYEDDKLVTDGLFDFLDDVNTKLGDEYAKMDESGKYAFDFTGEKLQEVADMFGTTPEMIQLFERAMIDAGMAVQLGGNDLNDYASKMDELTQKTDAAKEKLKEMQKEGNGQISSSLNLDYNAAEMSLDEIQSKIDELKQERITVEATGDTEGLQAIDDEISALQNQQIYMSIQAQVDSGTSIDELLAMEDEQLSTTLQIDTSQVDDARKQLESLNGETAEASVSVNQPKETTVKVTPEQEEIEVKVKDATVKVTPDPEEVEVSVKPVPVQTDNVEGQTDGITVKAHVDDTEEKAYQPQDKEATVTFDKDSSIPDDYVAPDKSALAKYKVYSRDIDLWTPPTKTGTVVYKAQVSGLIPPTVGKADGTLTPAHVSGTAYNVLNMKPAYANGKVALDKNEQAIVNELGTEGIIRNGRLFAIPGGMHMENLKKGDIILSAKQMKALFSGKDAGHARAYASGTLTEYGINAYDSGTGGTRRPSSGSNTATLSGNTSKDLEKAASDLSSSADSISTASESLSDLIKKISDNVKDWIETLISRTESKIDLYKAISENKSSINQRNKNITVAETLTGKEVKYYKDAYKKYMAYADNVASQVGLSAELKKKVQEGIVDIQQLSEDELSKVEAYSKWYDKAIAARQSAEEKYAEQVELAAQKLSNILDVYDSYINKNKAGQDLVSAKLDYRETSGMTISPGSGYTKLIQQQIAYEKSNIAMLKAEYKAYEKQLAEYGKKYGTESTAYREMQENLTGVGQALYESMTSLTEWTKTLDESREQITAWRVDKYSRVSDKLDAATNYKEVADGYTVTEQDYREQIKNNNSQIAALYKEREEKAKSMEKYAYNSEEYQKYADEISQLDVEILNLSADNEELKNSMMELRWKPFDDAQEKLSNLVSEYDSLRDLMDSDTFISESDGSFTENGLTNLLLLQESIDATKTKMANYRKQIDNLNKQYANGNWSQEEYNEKLKELQDGLLDSAKAAETYKQSILDLYEEQLQKKNELMQEDITGYKNALDAKKKYHDYDKQLKSQTKELNILKAQAAALEGVKSFALIYLIAGKP